LKRGGLIAWDTVVAETDDRGIPHLRRDIASPAGKRGSAKMAATRATIRHGARQ
jgi:hypothetical protein